MRCARAVAAAVLAGAMLAAPGCVQLPPGGISALLRPALSADDNHLPPGHDAARGAAPKSPHTKTADAKTKAADAAAVRAVLARATERERDGRTRPVWIRSIDPDAAGHRWRYPNLDELLARPADARIDWRPYLDDDDPIVAANAALALARQGDAAGMEQLASAIRTPTLPLAMRCAAAEGLGQLAAPTTTAAIGELLEQYGRVPPAGSEAPYVPELHAELLGGLARHVDAADAPAFLAALASPAAPVRCAALAAWQQSRTASLPQAVVDLRTCGQREVRAAALSALTAHRHPQTEEYLGAALNDLELSVQLEAIRDLGAWGGPHAAQTLRQLLQPQKSERVRMAAVAALGQCQQREAAFAALDDPSWRVRGAVADMLRQGPSPHAVTAARRLLNDPSVFVQAQVVTALGGWPAAEAGPLLLEAMRKDVFLTRRDAAARLAALWPPAGGFPVEGPVERRREVLAELEKEFHRQFAAPVATTAAAVALPPRLDAAALDRLAAALDRGDRSALDALGPQLPAALEQLSIERARPLPEPIWREVLPRYDAVYALLTTLDTPEAGPRRKAAGELGELAAHRLLPQLALERLAARMPAETDAIVWQRVLDALAADGRPAANRLAYVGLGHESSEVRRRACDHLAAFPATEHVRPLLGACDDRSTTVACAAMRAVGLCGDAAAAAPTLQRLLADHRSEIYFEAGLALARLGDETGRDALERAAYQDDPTLQRRAAEAMGELGDRRFVPALIHLLDGQVSVQRAALAALDQIVGPAVWQDSPDSAPGGDPAAAPTTSQRVEHWKRWSRGG